MSLKKVSFLLLLLLSVHSFAKEELFHEGFIQLPKYIQKEAKMNSNEVIYFFDFNCIYCKAFNPYIVNWGATLPKDLTFIYHPVITKDPMYLLNAAAWKFVDDSTVNASLKYKYLNNIFNHIHQVGNVRQLGRLVKESISDINLDVDDFAKKIASGYYDDYLSTQAKLQSAFNISITPSVVFGGSIMTHMGLNKGEVKDFITLLNAVASYYIYQERDDDKSITK